MCYLQLEMFIKMHFAWYISKVKVAQFLLCYIYTGHMSLFSFLSIPGPQLHTLLRHPPHLHRRTAP